MLYYRYGNEKCVDNYWYDGRNLCDLIYYHMDDYVMNIGDLVRVRACTVDQYVPCQCFFCGSGSNRIGFILGPAPREGWAVQFDTGQWRLYPMDFEAGDAEVISENR